MAVLAPSLQGMPETHPGASALERRITVVAVVLPFAGFLAAIWLLWGGAVSWLDLGILAGMYALVGFGVTIGFHRMLTHRAFDAKPWVRGTFAILGSVGVDGGRLPPVGPHPRPPPPPPHEGGPR